jgi:DNA-binding XRE family transcriptional regulator
MTPAEIRYHRESLGWTQAQLAEELDASLQSIKAWEAGRRQCKGPAAKLLRLLHSQAFDEFRRSRWPAAQGGGKYKSIRPKYVDLAPGDWAAASEYDWCELKHDGEYGKLCGGPDGWLLRSRTGHYITGGSEPLPPCCLLVEQITGTEWAREHAPAEIRGRWVAWSAVGANGQHLSLDALGFVVLQAQEAGLPIPRVMSRITIDSAEQAWQTYVEQGHWEGLIFRTHDGKFGRMKKRVTKDYVCIGVDENKLSGALSLRGGLFNSRGSIISKVSVPVSADNYDETMAQGGQVFEASGLAVTSNGSLRNPRFVRWRPDKPAEECTT